MPGSLADLVVGFAGFFLIIRVLSAVFLVIRVLVGGTRFCNLILLACGVAGR
jgi:hypothetical protein